MSKRSRPPVLLKLTGECLDQPPILASIADQLRHVCRRGTPVAVVVGGGNFIRGRDSDHNGRVAADRAGMVATVINGIRLAGMLSRRMPVCHLAAFGITGIVERYTVERAR
ncbi:MAG: UMP kinase, partial [candidate division WOR-3 bacterium]